MNEMMTRHNTRLYFLAVAVVCLAVANADGSEPVLPGAVGFSTTAHAGRGGRIIRVTNFSDKGPGSLRAAVEAKGTRIVVFEVGGVIDLNRNTINITEPFLTVAGQTAPSPGITLIRGGISIRAANVLIRHLRVRPGDAGGITLLADKPVWPEGLQPLPAKEVVDHVVKHAGARPADRDAIDRRIIQNFLDRKGRIIDSQEEVEGYPRYKMTRRPLDVPNDDVQGWLARMAAAVE